jgi:DnaJ-class molecular chaperone
MSAATDYYELLGVSKNASDADIKKAYRKLAREHHPDMVKDSDKAAAEKKFKEINEAYQVLSDSQKRKQYDQFGHAAFQQGGGAGASGFGGFGQGPFQYSYNGSDINIDPFEIFEEVFGFRGFGGSRAPKKGKNLYYEVRVAFEEAVKGGERKIKVESGEVTVKIPKGINDGQEMRFEGRGMPGPNGLPNGDLIVAFRVSFPQSLERYSENVLQIVEVDFIDALLGGEIEVKVIDENSSNGITFKKVKVPEKLQFGSQIVLKGMGMPKLNSAVKGDMYLKVLIKFPEKLSKNQRKHLEEYRKIK